MNRAATRALPIVLAAGGAFVVLRLTASAPAAPPPDPILAYRTAVGRPLEFRVERGDEDLAATVHLEVPAAPGAAPAAVRFTATTRLEDGAGQPLWEATTVVVAPLGALADGERPLTAGRVIRFPAVNVPDGGKAVVTVEPGLDAPAGGHAVIALERRAPRPSSWRPSDDPADDLHTRSGGDKASVLGWSTLDRHELAGLYESPTLRRSSPMGPGVDLVHVTPFASEVPDAEPPGPGEWLPAGRAAAWTVRGPGAVRLDVTGGDAKLVVAPIDDHGVAAAEHVTPGPGWNKTFAAPDGGALTVEVVNGAGVPVTARARAIGGARPLGEEPMAANGELAPNRRRLTLWRLAPGGAVVRATLVGDGVARVSIRPVPGADARLGWRLTGPDGADRGHGQVAVACGPAPFERYPASRWRGTPLTEVAPACEPVPFVATAPPGSLLELAGAAGTVDVSLEACDDADALRLAPAYDVNLDGARLRYAPYVRRRWLPFRPDNHAALDAAGARVSLEAEVRLEPSGPGLPPPGPYVAVEPRAPRTRERLVERDDAPGRARTFQRAGFATGDDARLAVAGDRLVLDYFLGPEALGGVVRVFVDGIPAAERTIAMTRGRLRIGDLDPGTHQVMVEGAPGFILAHVLPVRGGGAVWAERNVWRIARGETLTVPVALKEGEGRTLMFVVYTDEDAGRVTARVTMDGLRRDAGFRPVPQVSRLDRTIVQLTGSAAARWLDRTGGPRGKAVFGVRLGPDLGAGTHDVRVTLSGGPEHAHVRFFETGWQADQPAPRFGAEWEED